MTDKQEKKMIKAANKHWFDESGGYDKKDIMVDAFVEGYKQAFALYSVSQQRELLKVLEYTRQIKNNPKDIQLIVDKLYVENL